jgi:hypothetical protein
MASSVNTSLYFSTYLDNSLVAQNASPRFLSTLLPYLPNSQPQRYSFSAFDSEGDSLAYLFSTPQQGYATPAGCGVAVSGAVPAPHFQLAAATGALTPFAAATVQGLYALAVRVAAGSSLATSRVISSTWPVLFQLIRLPTSRA